MISNLVRDRRLVFSAIAAVFFVAAATGCTTTHPDLPAPTTPTTPTTPTSQGASAAATETPAASSTPSAVASPPFFPDIGQCIDVRKDRLTGPESIVPCNEEHDDEVYATFTLDGTEYPGEPLTERFAHDGCQQRFTDFIGISYEDSVFEFLPMFPSEEGWSVRGDRQVACLAWYPGDTLTRSLEGAGY